MTSFSFAVSAVLLLLGSSCKAFHVVPSSRLAGRTSSALNADYLSSLASGQAMPSTLPPPSTIAPPNPVAPPPVEPPSSTTFSHAPLSYFDLDKLTPKGPRKNADVGQPHDSSRPWVTGAPTTVGSWWCAAGGWPSLAQRDTTEIFYVFSGHGCLADLDGAKHYFGPGDTVVLPKGWSGRWDVLEDIHKVWVVHDHSRIEETSTPIRAVIAHYNSLAPQHMQTDNAAPGTASRTIYNVGPTEVGFSTLDPGAVLVNPSTTTRSFHVLEGVLFLANADGSAQRCVAGDTCVLPAGWTGDVNVVETVKKLWVVTPE